jgi:hypothetical protein
MLNLTFFPIGAILMVDGSWEDGRGGWYICDGQEKTLPNGSKQRTPDLISRFIRGGASAGNSGGANSIMLSGNNIPAHTHSVSGLTVSDAGEHTHELTSVAIGLAGKHGHGVSVTMQSAGEHRHTLHDTDHTHTPQHIDSTSDEYGRYLADSSYTSYAGTHTHTVTTTSVTETGTHTHTITGSLSNAGKHSHTISGGSIGGAAGETQAVSIMPAYYAVIYIKKMA